MKTPSKDKKSTQSASRAASQARLAARAKEAASNDSASASTRTTKSTTKSTTKEGWSTSRRAAKATPATSGKTSGAATGVFASLPRAFWLFLGVGLVAALAIMVKLFYVQIYNADWYRERAQDARTDVVTISATRGTIYDRNGNVLAVSVPAVTIYANPQEITDDPAYVADLLAGLLDGDAELIQDNIEWGQENDKQFIYIKRQATIAEASTVKALELNGVYYLDDTRREYPYGEVAGQIVGLCDAEGNGICGLELYYNDILSGVAGQYVAEVGESGLPIPGGLVQSVEAVDGQDIMITLDIDLQKELEESLTKAAASEGTDSASGIVMDASNGEILAMASLPLFNPADTSEVEDGATTLWPVSISIEPGSTFKSISATSMLEHGVVEPSTQIYCPTYLEANDRRITDSEERSAEIMDLNRIMAVSSNIGVVRLVEEYLGFGTLYKDIVRYGFTETTGIDFPGETAGYLDDYSDWTDIQAYNISFGQGISISGLQLVRFYGALANEGVACTPHFLMTNITTGEDATFATKQIINNTQAVEQMSDVLRHVITEGTGWQAAISDYYVVGKSGTAEIYSGDSYLVGSYNRSFIGYLDKASSPLVAYFVVNDVPHRGSVTPVTFRCIMQSAIERYRVTSDWDGVETVEPGVHIEVE